MLAFHPFSSGRRVEGGLGEIFLIPDKPRYCLWGALSEDVN